jgi:hypothetical protein
MKPVILAGMPRSGTSATARLVQALGVNIGSDLLPAGGGNLFGHFEEAAFIRFHDDLIRRFFPNRAPFCEWLPLADEEVTYTAADREAARSLWAQHLETGGIAWKDPRTSLFLDLWAETLPDAKIIICLRHPYQVHRSLLRRGEPFLHVDYSAAIMGSTVYNQRIFRVISSLPRERFLVVDVESGLKDAHRMAEGIARFLEIPCTEEALKAISPESFHFEDETLGVLAHLKEYFPATIEAYRMLKQFDFLAPAAFTPAKADIAISLQSVEARLIEFEEKYGLRATTRKMLIRSIAVDRQRFLDLFRQATRVNEEKDRLIEDLSQLTETLKSHLKIQKPENTTV